MLTIYGHIDDGSGLLDVRSSAHLEYDPHGQLPPCPALVGWVNADLDYHWEPEGAPAFRPEVNPAAAR